MSQRCRGAPLPVWLQEEGDAGRETPVIQCRRLGYAVMTTGRMDALAAYYEDVIGLYPSHREPDRTVFALSLIHI